MGTGADRGTGGVMGRHKIIRTEREVADFLTEVNGDLRTKTWRAGPLTGETTQVFMWLDRIGVSELVVSGKPRRLLVSVVEARRIILAHRYRTAPAKPPTVKSVQSELSPWQLLLAAIINRAVLDEDTGWIENDLPEYLKPCGYDPDPIIEACLRAI